jgi:HK97 family phage portal protein
MSIGDPAFAAWLRGDDVGAQAVSPYTVLGLSAVLRSVSVISQTIAGLPLRTYERQGDERARVPSVFDDPYPEGVTDGDEGMTPFAWVETVLIHQLLWRDTFLWHEARDRDGFVSAYRPLLPDLITLKTEGRRKTFAYRTVDGGAEQEVGRDWITHIPGPSLDGVRGHPMLAAARPVFSGVLAGDKAAELTLRRGIRLAGLITPRDGEELEPDEAEAILNDLRARVVGHENAGDIAVINRRLNLQPWTPNNIEAQWHETRQAALGEVGRIFGLPPHLLNDIEKQTSWGTGVAEQNLGFARWTLMGWTSRLEQALTRRLPRGLFVEFDYAGLFQGTPAQEIELLLSQVSAGLLTVDEARRIRNLPPLTRAQKAELGLTRTPRPAPAPAIQEAIT